MKKGQGNTVPARGRPVPGGAVSAYHQEVLIALDDPQAPDVLALLEEHLREMLETGTEEYFLPARALYAKHGFSPCAPFADYTEDPHSAYYTLAL